MQPRFQNLCRLPKNTDATQYLCGSNLPERIKAAAQGGGGRVAKGPDGPTGTFYGPMRGFRRGRGYSQGYHPYADQEHLSPNLLLPKKCYWNWAQSNTSWQCQGCHNIWTLFCLWFQAINNSRQHRGRQRTSASRGRGAHSAIWWTQLRGQLYQW